MTSSARERGLDIHLPAFDAATSASYLRREAPSLLRLLAQQSAPDQIPPNYVDHARLHWLLRARRVATVLEFGCGWSTLVIAAALRQNEAEWAAVPEPPMTRVTHPHHCYTVDTSVDWIQNVRRLCPADLAAHVTLSHSPASVGTANNTVCSYYDRLPDVVPDFVYLDGPDPAQVGGDVRGLSFAHPDRTVMAADLLLYEATLLPGAFVLIDGRSNNARFLARNLARAWSVDYDVTGDVTMMELQEPALGIMNRSALEYRLGHEYFDRVRFRNSQTLHKLA